MWFFLTILFLFGFLLTVTNLSLLKKNGPRFLLSAAVSTASFAAFPLAIKFNIQTLYQLMNDFTILSFVCTYQIVEAILFALLGLLLIKGHYVGRGNRLFKSLSLLPSGVFLAGLFFLQTYLFNVVTGMSFHKPALLFSGILLSILWFGAIGLKQFLPDWEWRMEVKIVLSFFQILLAMFLPLIVRGVTVRQSLLAFDIKTIFTMLAAMAVVAAVGFGWSRIKHGFR